MRSSVLTATAPAERLAAFRVALGVFVLSYLVLRVPVLLQLRDRRAGGFAGVGVLAWLDEPIDDRSVHRIARRGDRRRRRVHGRWWFRVAGPVFALATLVLTTYRSSWGQLLHFENLMVLHLLIVGFRRIRRRVVDRRPSGRSDRGPRLLVAATLACIVVVVAYVIAGVAKLRYGGIEWIVGDTLRNHIAYSAARLDLLGGTPSPLARPVVDQAWVLPPMAAASVAIELATPIALLGGWWRNGWVIAAWVMHVGIAALMLVAFPYPCSSLRSFRSSNSNAWCRPWLARGCWVSVAACLRSNARRCRTTASPPIPKVHCPGAGRRSDSSPTGTTGS